MFRKDQSGDWPEKGVWWKRVTSWEAMAETWQGHNGGLQGSWRDSSGVWEVEGIGIAEG